MLASSQEYPAPRLPSRRGSNGRTLAPETGGGRNLEFWQRLVPKHPGVMLHRATSRPLFRTRGAGRAGVPVAVNGRDVHPTLEPAEPRCRKTARPLFGEGLQTPPTPFGGPGRTVGLPPGPGLETFGRPRVKVRRPCHNLVRDCEKVGNLFPARF